MVSKEQREYLQVALEIAEEQAGPQGELRLVIVSESMAPLLRPGDAVYVRPQDSYRTGDILAYRSRKQVVTHRLIGQAPDRLTLKGDSARRSDPPIRRAAVLGRVVALERSGVRQPAPRMAKGAWIGRLSRVEAVLFRAVSGRREPGWRQRLGALLCAPLRLLIVRLARP